MKEAKKHTGGGYKQKTSCQKHFGFGCNDGPTGMDRDIDDDGKRSKLMGIVVDIC